MRREPAGPGGAVHHRRYWASPACGTVVAGLVALLAGSIQAYLAWAFERLGTHREVFGLARHEMTSAAFKDANA